MDHVNSPADDVRVQPDDTGDVTVCTVQGEIDISNVAELERGLAAALTAGTAVVVDLSAVTFLSSAGVRAVLDAWNDRPPEQALAVVTGPGVDRILRLCGIAAVVPCHQDRVAACREALHTSG